MEDQPPQGTRQRLEARRTAVARFVRLCALLIHRDNRRLLQRLGVARIEGLDEGIAQILTTERRGAHERGQTSCRHQLVVRQRVE
jgi:hypothetical protein